MNHVMHPTDWNYQQNKADIVMPQTQHQEKGKRYTGPATVSSTPTIVSNNGLSGT